MTGQEVFYRLSQIFEKMKPICALGSLWSARGRRRGIGPSTVSTHDQQIELLTHPGSRGFHFSIRQEIHHAMALQVHQDRTEVATTPEGKVVSPEIKNHSSRGIG